MSECREGYLMRRLAVFYGALFSAPMMRVLYSSANGR